MPRSGSCAGRWPLRERAGLGEPRPQGAAQKNIPHLYTCGMFFSDSLGHAVALREAGDAPAEGGHAHCTDGCMQSLPVCPASGAARAAGLCASAPDWAMLGPREQRRRGFHTCTSVECSSQTASGMRWLCAKQVTLRPKEVTRTAPMGACNLFRCAPLRGLRRTRATARARRIGLAPAPRCSAEEHSTLVQCGMFFSGSLGHAVAVREAGDAPAEGGCTHPSRRHRPHWARPSGGRGVLCPWGPSCRFGPSSIRS